MVVGTTAGHVHPALAVAAALSRRPEPPRVVFVGGREGPAARLLDAAGEPMETISGSAIKRAGPFGAAVAVARLWPAIRQSRRLLRRARAGVAIGFGSYLSGGLILAARSLRIPAVVHEANVRPGLANRLLKHVADRVYLANGAAAAFFPPARTRLVGMPLREAILRAGPASPPAAGRPVRVVVASGSRGHEFLAREVAPLLASIGGGLSFEVTTQTGSDSAPDVAAVYESAHVAIVRGGAGTLAELAAVGLPAIVVPLADAADDHQTANGRWFAASGAGLCVPESQWSQPAIAAWLRHLLTSPAEWQRSSAAARSLATGDAAAILADDLMAMLR